MNFYKTKVGQFNRRIELQSSTETYSSTGEPVKTWSAYATVQARIRTLGGNEKFAAQQVQASVSCEVTIRYSSDVSAVAVDDRIKYGGRYFDIKDVRNVDEKNIEIRMLCKEAL